ncbi:MAG: hypothetical protein GY946_02920 [bacterium]|nr:hypothetical protein [bacterium]
MRLRIRELMARLVVFDDAEGARFPFLRGILTRSLQEAGLPFERAYQLASDVRDEFEGVSEVTAEDLRARVAERLQPFGADVVERYLAPDIPATVQMQFSDGHERPFSRGRQRLRLLSCGLTAGQATAAAARIHNDLLARGITEITSRELRHLTHADLLEHLGQQAARNYVVWQEYKRSDRPLIVIIGGAVGSGKSTIAAEIGHHLDIVRTQSTDLLREVMRTMVPQRLLPMLHTSTFNAWQALPGHKAGNGKPAQADLVAGYLAQSSHVSVACEAAIQRAIRERVSLILEGVHAHPGLIEDLSGDSDAILVRVMLAVLKPRELKSRIRGRGKKTPDRRAKRYLDHFDSIWSLQSFMLSEADSLGVPIVANNDLDNATHQIVGLLVHELAKHFTGTKDEVL